MPQKIIVVLLLLVAVTGGVIYFARTNFIPYLSPYVAATLPAATPSPDKNKHLDYTWEVVAAGLEVPWSIVFTSPERMLVTERPGRIRVIESGKLQDQPLAVFPEVVSGSEEGLMGMALDPQYEQNKKVFICLAYPQGTSFINKIITFVDQGNRISEQKVILDGIPAGLLHAGCRVQFGPDQKLYITTGDATNKDLAQDISSLAGKILRINSDGSLPTDNPFPNSPVYSYGHRNPQGMAWQPGTNRLFATEHGPSGFDGPLGGDEINIIEPGGNYGWPVVSHQDSQAGMISPLAVYTPAVAPASAMFYSGQRFPQFGGHFFFGALKGEGIYHLKIENIKVILNEKLMGIEVGRVREVAPGPDGYIYFSSSNQDGRGAPRQGDDRIYRLVPSTLPTE